MSRAFVKEDSAPPPLVVPRAPLPHGVPNYVTPSGLTALRHERASLESARPHADDAGGATALAAHQARLAELNARIAGAVLVEPNTLPHDEIRFSATVELRGDSGDLRRYRIVGVDEADAARGLIAFTAPLARALIGKQLHDTVTVRTPAGELDLEIIRIDYAD